MQDQPFPEMPQRELGGEGLKVSVLGLGCMGISEFYGPRDDEESTKVIHRALELGVNFFDTADMYGMGHNEVLVGNALRNYRDIVIIASKFGMIRDPNDSTKRGVSGKPEYVKSACDASLKRLGIDYIDLYYYHRVDQNVPIEETVGAMSELVDAGKVRFLGLSEAQPEIIRRAYKVHPITALQTEYSLSFRVPEGPILDTCKELNIGFVAYSPLGRGLLTGKITSPDDLAEGDFRRMLPRFEKDNIKHNLALVNRLEEIATRKGITPSQLALAWVLNQGDHIVAIPGTKKIKYLEENIRATQIKLSPEEIAEINMFATKEAVKGTRYPEAVMHLVGE